MTSRSGKRGRKDHSDAEAPIKEKPSEEKEESKSGSDEPAAKRGRGRPRKPEHLKKKWVSSGRPRGRPRIHPLDPNKPRRPKGRPRKISVEENGSSKSKKVTSRGLVKKRGRPMKN